MVLPLIKQKTKRAGQKWMNKMELLLSTARVRNPCSLLLDPSWSSEVILDKVKDILAGQRCIGIKGVDIGGEVFEKVRREGVYWS